MAQIPDLKLEFQVVTLDFSMGITEITARDEDCSSKKIKRIFNVI